jgi:hypothetical protein
MKPNLQGGGPQVKKRRHKVVARSAAAALRTHGTIRFEECSCGAFRLRSVSKWNEPANSRGALTIAQACEFLHCGYQWKAAADSLNSATIITTNESHQLKNKRKSRPLA